MPFLQNYCCNCQKIRTFVAMKQYRYMLHHPKAERQFHNDIEAMEACDTCVLVLPCGRSAHTEAGWFAGKGCTTIAYIPEKQEPELMYKLFTAVCCSLDELITHVASTPPDSSHPLQK